MTLTAEHLTTCTLLHVLTAEPHTTQHCQQVAWPGLGIQAISWEHSDTTSVCGSNHPAPGTRHQATTAAQLELLTPARTGAC